MLRTYALILPLAALSASAAAAPPFIVLPDGESVTVRLTGAAPAGALRYEIRRLPDGEMLARGEAPAAADASGLASFRVGGLRPRLWWPQDPQLYEFVLARADGTPIGSTRFGFRTFQVRERRFLLNGRPLFLRGVPINPPGRDLPEAVGKDPAFIRAYLRRLKDAGVNLVRTDTREWLDACDELGMLVFIGRYGASPGGKPDAPPPFDRTRPAYREIFLNLANHPSVVIYVLTNEVSYKTPAYRELLARVREDVRLLDPTRPVIGNAGFGRGEPGEVYDLHPYWGWYSGNPCDWYRLAEELRKADAAGKPLTLSECVAAYTSDDGDFMSMSKQMATLLRWLDPADDPRRGALEYQAGLVRQVVETARRLRTPTTGLGGVMPFTYFLGWSRARRAEDLVVKPAFETLRTGYQPILLSPECWRRNVYAGDALKLRLCVVNDDDTGRDLDPSEAQVELVDAAGKPVASGGARFPAVPYYGSAWADVSLPTPASLPQGGYTARCALMERGRTVSRNAFEVTVAPRAWTRPAPARVALYDPAGTTAPALAALGVEVAETLPHLRALPEGGVLVIGEGSLGEGRFPEREATLAFVERGGRIVCLRQEAEGWQSDWLPARWTIPSARAMTYIHPVGGNAVIFGGARARDLRTWNELGRAANGIPDVCPVVGPLRPASREDLRHSRVWAVCDQMISSAALVEVLHGRGSAILSQFRCVERAAHDPIAARLLANLIAYAASGPPAGPVDLSRPVRWDLSAIRDGVFVSPRQGLLPHSPTYQHTGGSKGKTGDDHRIDGFALVGEYKHNALGWIQLPAGASEGWGVIYGTLTRPAARFVLKLRHPGDTPARILLKLDGKPVGEPVVVPTGAERAVEWRVDRQPGPVEVELRGDPRLVLLESRFE